MDRVASVAAVFKTDVRRDGVNRPVVPFLAGAGLATAFLLLLYYSSDASALSGSFLMKTSATMPSGGKDAADGVTPARSSSPAGKEEDEDYYGELQAEVLEKVANEDKVVIVTAVSAAWTEPGSLMDLFLESFRVGEDTEQLLDHLLVVAMDPLGFERCQQLHRFCHLHLTPGVNYTGENGFGSPSYVKLTYSKLLLHRRILELGYNVLFTDVDILWMRNPLKHVTLYADLTIACDGFNGDPDDIDNSPNTGLAFFKSNERTVQALRTWYEAKDRFPKLMEQWVFGEIKRDLVRTLGLRVRYVDPAYYGGFCNHGKDLGKIVTMHANCCVGLSNKLRGLNKVLADWKNYTSFPPEERKKGHFTWTTFGKD